jgi:hypothetical protein
MARSLAALCSRFFPLVLALCIMSLGVAAAGQSSTASEYHVEVLDAEYLTVADMALKLANNPQYLPPPSDTIQYKLINRGTSEINAFAVEFSVLVDGKDIDVSGVPTRMSLDLIDPQLYAQCQGSTENETEVPAGYSSTGMSFKPDEIYVGSLAANVDKTKLNAALPQVHVRVTGVIWADGKIEGKSPTPIAPLGITEMYRIRDLLQQKAAFEAKALAIVDAHPEDADIQHRIAEAIKGLQSLQQGYPHEESVPEGGPGAKMQVAEPPVVSGVIYKVGIAAISPNPKEMFETFDALWTCEHQRRVALLQHYATIATK